MIDREQVNSEYIYMMPFATEFYYNPKNREPGLLDLIKKLIKRLVNKIRNILCLPTLK